MNQAYAPPQIIEVASEAAPVRRRLADVPVGTTVVLLGRELYLAQHGTDNFPNHSFLWPSRTAFIRREPWAVMAAGWNHHVAGASA